jgi:hypothetical protein
VTKKTPQSLNDPSSNGQADAHEPANVSDRDLSFDPAELEGNPAGPSSSAALDPFDPAALRLGQDFATATGVRKVLLSMPVRKPDKSWFFRAHPAEAYRLQTAVIELKEDRETYLVARSLWGELSTEVTFKPKLLVTSINRQGNLFLWELGLPRADGRKDDWTRTALEILDLATRRWVRMVANMGIGAYECMEATAVIPQPEWPETSFADLLKLAFKDRFISDTNHPVLRRLRGEV